jgi:transposase-like protein
MGQVSQPVLPLQPAQARSIGPSAGLLEGSGGGVVFIFGLATFSYGPADKVGRRLAAVQLVTARIATSQEVAAAFGVSGVTLWTWRRDVAAGGVLALVRTRSGPRGPIKLTASLAARIAGLDAGGATLLKIAALTGVSTATVRVALGRVASRGQVPVEAVVELDEPKDWQSAEVATWWCWRRRSHGPRSGSRPGSGTWSRLRW